MGLSLTDIEADYRRYLELEPGEDATPEQMADWRSMMRAVDVELQHAVAADHDSRRDLLPGETGTPVTRSAWWEEPHVEQRARTRRANRRLHLTVGVCAAVEAVGWAWLAL